MSKEAVKDAAREAAVTKIDATALAVGSGQFVLFGITGEQWNMIFSAGMFALIAIAKIIEIIINLKKLNSN